MKTLILNGSPRINGDTDSLMNKITEKIVGEYRIVYAYRCNISPCLDCRYCWENNGCVINDEVQDPKFNEILGINIKGYEIYRSKGLPLHMVKRKHFSCLKYIDYILTMRSGNGKSY